MKNIHVRRGKYRAHIYHLGQRMMKTFDREADAVAWLAERREEIRRERRLTPPDNVQRRRVNPLAILFPKGPMPGLLSADEIIAQATPHQKTCGVYFLVLGKEVVYVGQSEDVHSRISAHERTKEFDSTFVVPCEQSGLSHMESRYIVSLRPRLNYSANGTLVLPLSKGLLVA